MKDLLLLAASGLAREIISAAQPEYRIVGILDDDPATHGTRLGDVAILGRIDEAAGRSEMLLVCAGAGSARRRIVERLAALGVLPGRFAIFTDSSARVPPSCTVGVGSVLLANVVLTADVSLGIHVVAMPNSTLTHDDVVEGFATLAAGVSLGGGVRLGTASYVGMNASIRQGVVIGADATIGMGAVVLCDVPAAETWVGVPARPLLPSGCPR